MYISFKLYEAKVNSFNCLGEIIIMEIKRSKGVSVRYMILAFVGAVFLIIAFLILFRATPIGDDILDMIYGLGGTYGLTSDTIKMEKAIECAYYRCAIGCIDSEGKMPDKIKTLTKDDFNCMNFCNRDRVNQIDNSPKDGKICGDESKKYPVEVTTAKPFRLTTFDIFQHIQVPDSCKPKAYDQYFPTINIEKALTVKNSLDSCTTVYGGRMSWATQCNLDATTYFIHLDHYKEGGAIQNIFQIVLCNQPPS